MILYRQGEVTGDGKNDTDLSLECKWMAEVSSKWNNLHGMSYGRRQGKDRHSFPEPKHQE